MEFVNGKDDIPNILQLENNPFMFQTTKQIIVVTYGPIAQELVTWDHLHGQRITMDHPLWLSLAETMLAMAWSCVNDAMWHPLFEKCHVLTHEITGFERASGNFSPRKLSKMLALNKRFRAWRWSGSLVLGIWSSKETGFTFNPVRIEICGSFFVRLLGWRISSSQWGKLAGKSSGT